MNDDITLRDYLAAHALTGYLSTWTESRLKPESAAKVAYEVADAMIEERNKRQGRSKDEMERHLDEVLPIYASTLVTP